MHEILTAETDRGRQAIQEVIAYSRPAGLGDAPAEWIRALVVEGRPVAFVAIDPGRAIAFPRRDVRYAFLRDGATREGARGRGHFRALLDDAVRELREAGIAWLFGRMTYGLGQRLGFAVFTNYSSIVLRPEEIEQTLGGGRPEGEMTPLLTVEESAEFQEDLLLVTEVGARTEFECVQALREAAWIARSRGKMRILFEHPPAAQPGSRFPIHDRRQTTLTQMTMSCGARIRVLESDSDEDKEEADPLVPADMVRLVSLPIALAQVLEAGGVLDERCPRAAVGLSTDAGEATLTVGESRGEVSEGLAPGALPAPFTAASLAQILTGYRSAKTIVYHDQRPIAPQSAEILDRVFPRYWRFSRNERWVNRQWTERPALQTWE